MTLVTIAIAWAVGIWVMRGAWEVGLFGCKAPSLPAAAGLLIMPIAGFLLGRRKPRLRLPATLLLFLLLGGLRYQLHPFDPCAVSGDLAFYNGTAEQPKWATVVGTVVRPPEARDTAQRVRLRVESVTIEEGEAPRPAQGDALFTVDRALGLRYGDRVLVQGRLEAPAIFNDFDYKAYLSRQGVHTLIQRPEVTVLARGQGSPIWTALYRLSERGQQAIARQMPEPESALLTGILLGVETGIDRDLYDQFNQTGTSHIIVISGFNIAIVAGVMTASFGRLVGKRRAFYPVVAGIIIYTLLVGADASVMRAAIMGLLVALANYLNRRSLAIVSLFAAGLLMTALNPLTLWDVGFQLSFLATLSLVLFATPMTERFERLMAKLLPARAAKPLTGFLNDALIVTLAAQILTLPLIAHYFGRLSVVSPLTNLLVLPVQPAVMIWGGASVILSLLSTLHPLLSTLLSPLVRLIMLVPWLALHWTVAVIRALASLPFASASVQLSAAGLVGYFALLGTGMLAARRSLPLVGASLSRLGNALRSSKAVTGAASLLLVACPLLYVTMDSLPDGRLHVHFMDVGQGEAVLIVTPDGQQVLIDGGASPTALLGELGRWMPFYDRQIELVVLTHAGDERVGGLLGLANRYRIGQVVQTPFPYPSAAYGQWLRELQEANVPVTATEAGMRVRLGYGAALDVLNPGPGPALGKDGELDLKANSMVLRLSWGRTDVLLLGDATRGVQEELVEAREWRVEGGETIVKVPDGGRQAAFSQKLLDAIRPQQAVVFAEQDDRYRDLAAGVEEAWKAQVGAAGWHRTDLEGTVSFASDGERIVVVK